ncbi:MAG: methyltransferase domain-containing protein [Gemmatimonadaceae bacterium]
MLEFLIPRRRYNTELLDSPGHDDELVLRTVRDIKRSNRVLLGARAALAELDPYLSQLPAHATLLDVGTGFGDLPRAAAQKADRFGKDLTTIGLDANPAIARGASRCVSQTVCASGLALPFPSASVDIVMCSQTLHHFRGDDETMLLGEMNRVAKIAVVVSDLRRSWIAASGFWLASYPLGFHRVTRHDGVLSVLRGYTRAELSTAVFSAVGLRPVVHQRPGFRITTSWSPVRDTP